MGIFDKIKGLFSDDEIVEEEREIEVENKIEIPKLPQVMLDSIEKEDKKEEPQETLSVSDRDLIKTKTKFNFPVEFDDKEFEMTRSSRNINVKKQEEKKEEIKKEIKKPLYTPKEEKSIFRCTPIISPVYGILDKNYRKEELKEKDEKTYEIQRTNRKVDFETVRNKAFGSLTDELKENLLCDDCVLMKEAKEKEQYKENLLYDITLDDDKTLEEVEDNYSDFGIVYESSAKPNEKVINIKPTKIDIDIINNIENQENELEIVDYNQEKPELDHIEVKEETRESKLGDLELTDDLFNIIDSMYEGKE